MKNKCKIHGHSLMPVLGFDNEISDYQCMICGIFERKIKNIPFGTWIFTNGDELNQGQVVDYDVLNDAYMIDKKR